MKTLAALAFVFILAVSIARADICMPKSPTMMEKLGRGLANVALAPAEIIDSTYGYLDESGNTVAATTGLTQGVSRMLMDIGIGVFEVATFWYPSESAKFPAHDSLQVNPYPPADLINNWY